MFKIVFIFQLIFTLLVFLFLIYFAFFLNKGGWSNFLLFLLLIDLFSLLMLWVGYPVSRSFWLFLSIFIVWLCCFAFYFYFYNSFYLLAYFLKLMMLLFLGLMLSDYFGSNTHFPNDRKLLTKNNAVSSFVSSENSYYIQAISISSSARNPLLMALNLLQAKYRHVQVIELNDYSVQLVIRSSVFKFPDDIRLFWNSDQSQLHIQSKSRFGYSDFGVNRSRFEWLRANFSGK